MKRDNNSLYPYRMEINGYNRYSISENNYSCKEYFDCKYETLNPEEILFPISFEILDGYRIINYKTEHTLRSYIKLMVIDKYLECFDETGKIILTYNELEKLSRNELIIILTTYTNKLNIDINELIDIIYFMINHQNEFDNLVINKKIFKEKTRLNRPK